MYLNIHPETFRGQVLEFLFNHMHVSDLLFQMMIIVELIFIVALFTRKFDVVLGVSAILFHLLSWFLMRAFFMEFATVAIVFLFTIRGTAQHPGSLYLPKVFKTSKSLFAIVITVLLLHTVFTIRMYNIVRFEDYDRYAFTTAFPAQNYLMFSYAWYYPGHI